MEGSEWRRGGWEDVEEKAGARFYCLLGHSKGFGLYPSVTTSNGRLSRVEM